MMINSPGGKTHAGSENVGSGWGLGTTQGSLLPWLLRAINQEKFVFESRSQPVSRTRVQAFWVSVSALSTKLFLSVSDNCTGSRKSLHNTPPPPPPSTQSSFFQTSVSFCPEVFFSCPKHHNEKTQKLNNLVKHRKRETTHGRKIKVNWGYYKLTRAPNKIGTTLMFPLACFSYPFWCYYILLG